MRCDGLTFSPVVAGAASMPRHKEILRVVEVRVEPVLNAVDDSRLQVDEERAWDVMLVIRLIEEDIFAVVALRGVLL